MTDEKLELATLPIRIYELKRLIKANGPKREPIEVICWWRKCHQHIKKG